MTNDCKTCPVSTGTHKPAEAVHQIDEPKLSIEAVLSDLRESHARTTFGHWGKGDTTHETVSRGGRHKEYKIAEFRHADDATFCDLAHAFTPRLIEEIEIQRARIAELESQLEAIGAGGVEPLRKCNKLHQIAEPATVQAAPSEVMGALRALHDSVELAIQRGALSERALEIIIMQPATDVLMRAAAPQAVQAAVPEAIEQMAVDRYKVVPSHESMFHRWAVVADNGAQQLYIGREGECQNMARKFMGAFLDGAFVAMQNATPAHPAEGVHCSVCGADEAFTGTCGGGRSNPRALCFERAALAATHPTQQGAPTLPEGWVPCVITYEGQHPEEIAYGPQVMMDRLKKWLDRYFEMRAAPAHPAEGVPAQDAEAKIAELLALARVMVRTALDADNKTQVQEIKAAIESEVAFERALRAALAATQPAAQGIDGREFPPLTPELASILGLPCFQCIPFAKALRAAGHTIKTRAEDEQAAVLHWMLGHYFRHGDDWSGAAAQDMSRMKAEALAAQAKQGGV